MLTLRELVRALVPSCRRARIELVLLFVGWRDGS